MDWNITRARLEESRGALVEGLDRMAALVREARPLALAALDKGGTLFINIDVNNGFAVSGALCSREAAALVEPTAALFARVKQAGFDTLAYCDCHPEQAAEFGLFPAHCVSGSGEDRVVEPLEPFIDRVVYKNSTNGLVAPGEELFSRYRAFVVTGCLTELCVFQYATTLRAALNERGRDDAEVIVPLALIDSYDAPGHPALLYNLVYAAGLAQSGVRLVSGIEAE